MGVRKQLIISVILCLAMVLSVAGDLCAQDTTATKYSARKFAVKTNMLYDVLLVPNLGLEFGIDKANRYSVTLNGMYAWWHNDRSKWYHRTYGGDLGVRRWFGKQSQEKNLTGFHAGVYGQMLTYDILWGKRGYIADEFSFAAGIDGGYSLPIFKSLNIDFNIGLGYMWGEYEEYVPMDDCYVWQATKIRRWLGPTKAEVQLVWIIGGR
ncbi:MAG: DUF3575 domain-containing protein [Bacteroidales bacterium]|nr:DUF3575 domain-containing protein [Bacteroidales bacterium]